MVKFKIGDHKRNHIFLAVVGTVLIILIIEFSAAARQNTANKKNYIHYQQAAKLMQQKQFSQAQMVLTQLDNHFKESYQVLFRLGICAEAAGDYATAANYMHKVQQICPALLMDQTFLFQYGQVLYRQGEYNKARLYFIQSQKYKGNSRTSKLAEEYLMQIEAKNRSKN